MQMIQDRLPLPSLEDMTEAQRAAANELIAGPRKGGGSFHPAFAQMIFRIADSAVLPLAPMSPFLPLFLGFLQRYRKDAQLGTYYVLIAPYPLLFFCVWLLLLLAWYALGLPIGPGVWPTMPT